MLSEGGLRHILAKSVPYKFGFHYALILFCQLSARCCHLDRWWSNVWSSYQRFPSVLGEDSWGLRFTQSFKSELKQDFRLVALLCKLGRMWFRLLISSREAKIFSDGWKGVCFIWSHWGCRPQSAVSHSHFAEVPWIIWTRNEIPVSRAPGFLSLVLIN